MRRTPAPAWRPLAWALVLALVAGGCLSLDEPTPAPLASGGLATAEPTVPPSPTPRDSETLLVIGPAQAQALLPPASNASEALLHDLLYDPLYRLDAQLVPQPELAASLPAISEDGLTWTVDLVPGATFHDGQPVAAHDVDFTLRLAVSPACSLGRDLCDTAAAHIEAVEAVSDGQVAITLDEPYAPFMAEVLGRLPILSERSVKAGTAALVRATDRLEAGAPDGLVKRIAEATESEACFDEEPPEGCRLADYQEEMEAMLMGTGIPWPSRQPFTDVTGGFDAEAYAGAMLERVAALGRVLDTRGTDQHAAALPILDISTRPLGGGPFRLAASLGDGSLVLEAHEGHVGGTPGIRRIRLENEPDPARAATRMLAGEGDWLLQAGREQAPSLADAPGLTFGRRPLPLLRTILFNVRPGLRYADLRVRQAFDLCLDRDAITTAVGGDPAALARSPYAPGSWANQGSDRTGRDPAAAAALLERSGWTMGPDGIRRRGELRLSSEIAVRPSRPELLAFAHAAAAQLAECGIELRVREIDLTGDTLLTQMSWPNQFDTLLVARPLGLDPDHDARAFEGRHVTTEQNPNDANPGGYSSPTADRFIGEGRSILDPLARRTSYGQLEALLAADLPQWPIWYDTAASALSDRVRGPAGPLDPTIPRFDWDVASWTLSGPP